MVHRGLVERRTPRRVGSGSGVHGAVVSTLIGVGAILPRLMDAPWWATAGSVGLGAMHAALATVLGIVRTLVPQTSSDRRRVWEALIARCGRGERQVAQTPRGESEC